jgi:predicted nucleic acid-binding protein
VSADERGLLDTSTLILLDRFERAALPTDCLISTITLAELSVGPLVAKTLEESAARQISLQMAEADFDPVPFDADAARAFAGVSASLRSKGRKASARAFDSLIAATAIANGLPLYTCSPDDFAGIDGLTVRTLPHPGKGSPPDGASS